MAMTFSSQGCKKAASDLIESSNHIDSILNGELANTIEKIKTIYNSDTANELYAAFEKMKQKFPEFIQSITDCSKYLSETVAPAYEKVEQTAASKLG